MKRKTPFFHLPECNIHVLGCWIVLILFFSIPVNAQVDSLITVLESQLNHSSDQTAKAKIWLRLYDEYLKKDYSRAWTCNHQVLNMDPKVVQDKAIWGQAYFNRATEYYIDYNNQKALTYYFKALHTINPSDAPELNANCYAAIGLIYRTDGNIYQSIQYFYRALALCGNRNGKFFRIKTKVLNQLALTNLSLGQVEKAATIMEQNLAAQKGQPYHPGKGEIFNVLSMIAGTKNDTLKMIDYALQSIELRRLNGGYLLEDIHAYQMLETAFFQQGKKKEAMYYWKKAFHLADSMQEELALVNLLTDFAKFQEKENHLEPALAATKQALQIALSDNMLPMNQDVLYQHYSVLKKLGKYEEALYYLKYFQNYKDSIKSNETKDYALTKFNQYNSNQQQDKINQQYISQVEVEKQRRATAIFLVFLALTLCGFAITLFRQRNQAKRKIEEKQANILHQARVLQELSDLKNYLFSTLSQHLRTPIRKIRQTLEALKVQGFQQAEQQSFQELDRLVTFTSSELEELLLDSRLQTADEQTFFQRSVRLHKLCQELVKEVSAYLDGASLILDLQMPTDLQVHTDPRVLKVLLRKLLLLNFAEVPDTVSSPQKRYTLQAWREELDLKIRLSEAGEPSTNPTDSTTPDQSIPIANSAVSIKNLAIEWGDRIGAVFQMGTNGFDITLKGGLN
jgi:tetratricopeptide (TPR) repeat protein